MFQTTNQKYLFSLIAAFDSGTVAQKETARANVVYHPTGLKTARRTS